MLEVSILIADDHPIVLHGFESVMRSKGYKNIFLFSNGIEAFNAIVNLKPNIAILDLDMPGMSGLEIAEHVLQKNKEQKIVLLTIHKELSILKKCKNIGVKGYLLKEFALEEIETCFQEVLNGKEYYSAELEGKMTIDSITDNELDVLTPSEKKILKYIGERKTSKEIAETLFISEKTIEKHRSNIIHKLNLPKDKRSLIELAIKARL